MGMSVGSDTATVLAEARAHFLLQHCNFGLEINHTNYFIQVQVEKWAQTNVRHIVWAFKLLGTVSMVLYVFFLY